MVLSEITLHQFRSHHEKTITLNPRVTFICGPNGIGKTNILEAIYVLFRGKSFRDGDNELIEFDNEWWRIEGIIDSELRDIRYSPSQQRYKQLHTNGVSKGRFTYRQQLPIVLFEPDDLLVVHGSPSTRRNLIDDLILATSPTYRQTLSKYERTLLQRNNLLKNKAISLSQLKDRLFVWDVSLSELGAEIVQKRAEIIDQLNSNIGEVYSHIANKPQVVELLYESKLPLPATSSILLQGLHANLEKDIIRGSTSVGPHRDDIDFILNSSSAKHTASRGEIRSLLLSLKFIELDLIEKVHGVKPIFLLDDVFSELDEVRQNKLIENTNSQMVITTNKVDNIKSDHKKITLA